MDPRERALEIVNNIKGLPSLPQVLTRLFALMQDQQASAAQVAETLSRDPALTAKVLGTVNSAFYGLRQEVRDVQHAVAYLGMKAVRNLALAAVLYTRMQGGKRIVAHYVNLWKHSLMVGVLAEFLAEQFQIEAGQELFSCGVLHDLGKMIELGFLPDIFLEIRSKAEADKLSFLTAEMEVLGTNHVEIADLLFERWKLSLETRSLIRGEHSLESIPEQYRKPAAVLALANHQVISHRRGSGFNHHNPQLEPATLHLLSITEEELSSMEEQVQTQLERGEELFHHIK